MLGTAVYGFRNEMGANMNEDDRFDRTVEIAMVVLIIITVGIWLWS